MMCKRLCFLSLILMSLSCLALWGQSVKVKKGEVLIDGNPVARISHTKNKVYSFCNLKGDTILSLKEVSNTLSGISTPEEWLMLSFPNGNHVEIANPDATRLVISLDKYFTYKLFDMKPQLMNKEGFISEAVAELSAVSSTPFSAKWDSIYKVMNSDAQEAEEKANSVHLNIRKDGGIYINNQLIGKVVYMNNTKEGDIYRVFDLENNKIGELVSRGIMRCYNFTPVKTFDGNSYYMKQCDGTYQLNDNKIAYNLVAMLLAKGYSLGNMTDAIANWKNGNIKSRQEKLLKEEQELIAKAKSNSVNIYNMPGVVVFADGSREKGNITILYESLEKKMGKLTSGIIDLDNLRFGADATLVKEGTSSKLNIKAKEHPLIVIGERKYLGVKGIGDSGLKYVSTGDALVGVTKPAQFYEVVYMDNEGNYILQHPLDTGELLLKLKGKEDAIYLGKKGGFMNRSIKKINDSLKKYLDCPKINAEEYDTLTKEGLKKVIDDYMSNCGN